MLWQEEFQRLTQAAAKDHLERLIALEQEHRVHLVTVTDCLQERFVKVLALDRLCALIAPAMNEARQPGNHPSFDRLRHELQPLTATPTGVGLDVPQWLRRLEAEVQRVWATQSAVAVLAEELFRIPHRPVSHEDVQQQLHEWEEPLSE